MAHRRQSQVFVVGSYVLACCWYVPRLPQAGESLMATAMKIEPGGKGLNVAVGLARLGCTVSALFGCGRDVAGARLLALLAKEGVEHSAVARFAARSGMGCGLVGPDGENQIAVYAGANLLLTERHALVAADRISSARMVYAQFEAAMPAIERAFRIAAGAGVATVLNPSPWQQPSTVLRETTQVLIVNRLEAQALCGDAGKALSDPQAMGQWHAALDALVQDWPRLTQLQITLGADGGVGFVRAPVPEVVWHAFRVTGVAASQVTDTVGAGDAFAAAYIASLVGGCTVPVAMQQAHRCAAHLVNAAGVLESLPSLTQLQEWHDAADLPGVRQVWSSTDAATGLTP